MTNGRPDYGPVAMTRKYEDLADFNLKLTGIGTDGWTPRKRATIGWSRPR